MHLEYLIKLELLGCKLSYYPKIMQSIRRRRDVYTLMNVGIAFGGKLMTLLFYQWRNQAVEKQTKTTKPLQYEDKISSLVII